jgi:hypothetical protein
MISFIDPLPIGNAIRVILAPPVGSVLTRVLRNTSGTFAGAAPGVADSLVFEGQDSGFIDATGLLNGTAYSYGAFDYVNGAWVASPVATATPAATAAFVAEDVLTVVCDRLRAGLQTQVLAGALQHDNGSIPVLTAPPIYENTKFPVVSVHLRANGPAEWGLGEFIGDGGYDPSSGLYTDAAGYLGSTTLEIIAWVVNNPDVRIALRKAIRGVLIGNLPIFDQAGMAQISINQTDMEDFESYAAPVYMTTTTFSCLAPEVVTSPSDEPLSDSTLAVSYD